MFRLFLAFCLLLPAAHTAQAAVRVPGNSPEATEKRLDEVRSRIERLQREIEAQKSRAGALGREIEAVERRIGAAQGELAQLNQQLRDQQLRVRQAQEDLDEAEDRLDGQRQSLAAQLRAAYLMGHNPSARLLLNLSNVHAVDRMITYFDYLSRARAEQMREMNAQADTLRALRDRLEDEADALVNLREEQEAALQRLAALRSERERQLAEVQRELGAEQAQLEALRETEREVAQVFSSIQKAMKEAPPPTPPPPPVTPPPKPAPALAALSPSRATRAPEPEPEPETIEKAALGAAGYRPFPQLRGRLPWPVRGPLLAAFGQPKAGGRLSWNGHWIGAAPGAPVQAVAPGRVVYTGWMHRYGLIVILEHDNGYFTLYGHNQTVSREAGDVVRGGEVIATAGNTGGHTDSGVYFEVRKGTLSLDPRIWLTR